MEQELCTKPEILLIGLSVRTNNKDEFIPAKCKIGELVEQYSTQNIADQIPNRKNPGVTLVAYSEYANKERGDFTYLIGEEVTSFDNMPSTLQKLIIAPSSYQKFTTAPGKVPNVVIDAWEEIWKMAADELGGDRAFVADFEVYDQRAADLDHTALDIYIGIIAD